MKKRIIAISREFGSGGRFIGEEIAKKLGIAYYDKDIISQIAEKSGLSPDYIKESGELHREKECLPTLFPEEIWQENPSKISFMRNSRKSFYHLQRKSRV